VAGTVDVVVVSYNSASTLRGCVEPLASAPGVHVVVVDNASPDASVECVSDLPVTLVQLDVNHGFAYGCNRGVEAGSAPRILFLNPDARISNSSLQRLVEALEDRPRAAVVAPRIVSPEGSLEFSLRRFPRLLSTYSRALFLHRLFPRSTWSDEDVRDEQRYACAHAVDWVSGACLLVRRPALAGIGGWDEGFFLYGEDMDLCRRLNAAGHEIWFDPSAEIVHIGGMSGPKPALRPLLVASRIRYARKHFGPAAARFEQLGLAIEESTRILLTTKGGAARAGHRRALRAALSGSATPPL
jgi:N-acetylglucosaminyl-diphospho-decaprenol L-rhamnosyltransferase